MPGEIIDVTPDNLFRVLCIIDILYLFFKECMQANKSPEELLKEQVMTTPIKFTINKDPGVILQFYYYHTTISVEEMHDMSIMD